MIPEDEGDRSQEARSDASDGVSSRRPVSELNVSEVRELVAGAHPEPGDSLWRELRADGRKGVSRLLEEILRRRERESMRSERETQLRRHERGLWEKGLELVAGVDEAGRGPLAGPVVAAAVILPRELPFTGIDDSKKLTGPRREELFNLIREHAVAVGVGSSSEKVIDEINILRATHAAMKQAVDSLGVVPDHVLIDGDPVPALPRQQTAIHRGDEKSAAIAAASIVAKVTRDRLLVEYDARYPGYGFAGHKGYGTPEHLSALTRLGPCEIHRRSFAPVLESGGGHSEDYQRFRRLLLDADTQERLDEVAADIARRREALSAYELSKLRGLFKRSYARVRVGLVRSR